MNKKLRTILIVVALIAVFFAMKQTGLLEILADFDKFQAFIENAGTLGYGLYILLYILVAVFSLPASIITIAAGIIFGPVLGGVLALIGGTIGAAAAFIVARYIARDFIVDKFGKNKIFQKIEKGVETNGKDFLILTRLVPVFPYNIQNYAYGVTSINLVMFTFISLITMAPGAFIYAYLAGEIAVNGVSTGLFIKLLVAGLVLFGVSQIPKLFAKRKGIDLDDLKN
ncbi:MAG: TVP38/TMEM64 family protein [Firmicutes bacterium]|jgi:uncharacterized membrane protein YdjX (TVP38/TMEM64 family)|nr:TVP38/TMEM64 family protein [Bacillota bacterium]